MIFNKVDPKHLGGGVVLFEGCLDLDWENLIKRSNDLIEEEWNEMYSTGIDPETNEEIYINKSGYFFNRDSIDLMPKRASAIRSALRGVARWSDMGSPSAFRVRSASTMRFFESSGFATNVL